MKSTSKSAANHWHLIFENVENKQENKSYGLDNAFLFLSDLKYCIQCLVFLHKQLYSWCQSLQNVESILMMYLHYNNTLRNDNVNQLRTISGDMRSYLKREIYCGVKEIYANISQSKFLMYATFWSSCIWEEESHENDALVLQYMYMNEHEYTLPVSSGDIVNWIHFLFGLTEELLLIQNRNIQLFAEWLVYVQLCNIGVQILHYIAATVEKKISQLAEEK